VLILPVMHHMSPGIGIHSIAHLAVDWVLRSTMQGAQRHMGHTLHGRHDRALQQTTVSLPPDLLSCASNSSGECTCICTVKVRNAGVRVRRTSSDRVHAVRSRYPREAETRAKGRDRGGGGGHKVADKRYEDSLL